MTISNIILKYETSTQTVTKFKLIIQQIKSIGGFDYSVYNENIKQIKTVLDRPSKVYSCLQKNIRNLNLNSLQTYTSNFNPHITPVSRSKTDRARPMSDTVTIQYSNNSLHTSTHSPVSDQQDSG